MTFPPVALTGAGNLRPDVLCPAKRMSCPPGQLPSLPHPWGLWWRREWGWRGVGSRSCPHPWVLSPAPSALCPMWGWRPPRRGSSGTDASPPVGGGQPLQGTKVGGGEGNRETEGAGSEATSPCTVSPFPLGFPVPSLCGGENAGEEGCESAQLEPPPRPGPLHVQGRERLRVGSGGGQGAERPLSGLRGSGVGTSGVGQSGLGIPACRPFSTSTCEHDPGARQPAASGIRACACVCGACACARV